jgi:molecular chaperone DnaK
VEKHTGKHIDAVIENAIPRFTESDLAQTRERIDSMWSRAEKTPAPASTGDLPTEFADIIGRAEQQLDKAIDDDREEIVNLVEDIRDALQSDDIDQARRKRDELDDLLFYLES